MGAFTLSGRYLAARVAELDHDYDAAAEQIDLALAQAPNDPELVDAAFRMRIQAGRVDQAAQLAPQVLAAEPKNVKVWTFEGEAVTWFLPKSIATRRNAALRWR